MTWSFPNTLGNVQSLANTTQRVWRPLQKKAGLVDENGEPRFDFHTLRHFAAHSGDCDQPFRPKVITDSGDRDHATTPSIVSA